MSPELLLAPGQFPLYSMNLNLFTMEKALRLPQHSPRPAATGALRSPSIVALEVASFCRSPGARRNPASLPSHPFGPDTGPLAGQVLLRSRSTVAAFVSSNEPISATITGGPAAISGIEMERRDSARIVRRPADGLAPGQADESIPAGSGHPEAIPHDVVSGQADAIGEIQAGLLDRPVHGAPESGIKAEFEALIDSVAVHDCARRQAASVLDSVVACALRSSHERAMRSIIRNLVSNACDRARSCNRLCLGGIVQDIVSSALEDLQKMRHAIALRIVRIIVAAAVETVHQQDRAFISGVVHGAVMSALEPRASAGRLVEAISFAGEEKALFRAGTAAGPYNADHARLQRSRFRDSSATTLRSLLKGSIMADQYCTEPRQDDVQIVVKGSHCVDDDADRRRHSPGSGTHAIASDTVADQRERITFTEPVLGDSRFRYRREKLPMPSEPKVLWQDCSHIDNWCHRWWVPGSQSSTRTGKLNVPCFILILVQLVFFLFIWRCGNVFSSPFS